MATSIETSDLDGWGFGQVKKSNNAKNGVSVHTPSLLKQFDWDPEETAEKTSYDNEDRFCEPEAATEYNPSARDTEPSPACDLPILDAEEEPMGKKLGEYEAATVAATITAEEEEELAALTLKKVRKGKLLKKDRARFTLLKQRAEDSAQAPAAKEDKSRREEENAAAEAKPIEDAKPVDEEEKEEPKRVPNNAVNRMWFQRFCDEAGQHHVVPESDRQPRLERRAQGARSAARLSLRNQHELMVDLQKYLERACYTYAREHMQDVLEEQCWDCAEAAQLSDWMQQFLNRRSSFDMEANADELMKLFQSGIEIRNAAVRRHDMESDEMIELLVDAERLVGVLQVHQYQNLVRNLRVRVEKAVNELIQDKSQWQDRLEKKLACIAAEEAKLNDMKRAVMVENENSMKESQDVAGLEIRDALDKAEVTFKTEVELDSKHRWTLIQLAYPSKAETDV
ncbi:hypothetical protein Forpe1208_v012549 [Fusarium oxysporum f. sp. rapae]|uniref:Uncharacterized protein n=1 Tax=Fusarium oxysporum f. sp. rapae TaxID=485398 RepID=A0A8J5TR19_FUSOX|nr:hypothetical protein Forpe1208_v012549 [Fusarium oxysporum f. sp. rapae]